MQSVDIYHHRKYLILPSAIFLGRQLLTIIQISCTASALRVGDEEVKAIQEHITMTSMVFFKCVDCHKMWTCLTAKGCNLCGSPCEVLDSPIPPSRYRELPCQSHDVSDPKGYTVMTARPRTENREQSKDTDCGVPTKAVHKEMDQYAQGVAPQVAVTLNSESAQPVPKWLSADALCKEHERSTVPDGIDTLCSPGEAVMDLGSAHMFPHDNEVADPVIALDDCGQELAHFVAMGDTPDKYRSPESSSRTDTIDKHDVHLDNEVEAKRKEKQRLKNKKKNAKSRKKAEQSDAAKSAIMTADAASTRRKPGAHKASLTTPVAQLEKPDPCEQSNFSRLSTGVKWSKVVQKNPRTGFTSDNFGEEVNVTLYAARKAYARANEETEKPEGMLVTRTNIGGAKHDTMRIVPRWVVDSSVDNH